MRIAGIVAEYNPFHSGHAYQIAETRLHGATHIVAVMSGNLVQRGDVPIASQWARTEAALCAGVDLVLQLPSPFALSSAQRFALGAVAILQGLGCVDILSFGSESGSLESLTRLAEALRQEQTQQELKRQLSAGCSYPRAISAAMAGSVADAQALLQGANNTLAIEYLNALYQLDSAIAPFTVARRGADHDSHAEAAFPSASYFRDRLKSGQEPDPRLPASTVSILKREIQAGRAPLTIAPLENALLLRLRQSEPEELTQYEDVEEGLENRMIEAARTARNFVELCVGIKTKRYTMARVRRILLRVLFDIKRSDTPALPPYLRVLGFNGRGVEVLRRAKRTATLPILLRAADAAALPQEALALFQLECRVSDALGLCAKNALPCGQEMTMQTIIQKEDDI